MTRTNKAALTSLPFSDSNMILYLGAPLKPRDPAQGNQGKGEIKPPKIEEKGIFLPMRMLLEREWGEVLFLLLL